MDEEEDLLNDPLLMPLSGNQIIDELRTQLAVGNYLSSPKDAKTQPDKTFQSNQILWNAVLSERLYSGTTIKLENFFLFEWFPRSPGLFYTDLAQWSRRLALQYTLDYPISSQLKNIDDASLMNNAVFTPDFIRIFDPNGKLQMLKGGIGSIRLQDKEIKDVGHVWFMTASSTYTSHEGFPIALPDIYYQKYIDYIRTRGIAPCTIIGKLRFVPDTLGTLYEDYTGVPQLYLLVEDVKPSTGIINEQEIPRVSVAAMFRSEYEGSPGIFSSYVTFFPSQPGSLSSRIEWLEDTYVKSLYKGEIITDFDEQKRHFESARFSLKKILGHQTTMNEVRDWAHQVLISYGNPTFLINGKTLVNIHAKRIAHMTYQEKVINIGNNNSITAPLVIADNIENSFNALKDAQVNDDIRKLLEELLKTVSDLYTKIPPDKSSEADSMVRDAEILVKEASSSKPRRQWYEVSLAGLKQAAANIGDLATPVLNIVLKLTPLLL